MQKASGDYRLSAWTKEPAVDKRVNPPKGIEAVVVDVRSRKGAINIFETKGNNYIDKVGYIQEDRNVVIVPWTATWWFYPIGSVNVAFLERT